MERFILKFILITFICSLQAFGQSPVKYGSHNGKYLTIRGTKVYYEEYGKGIPVLLLHGGFGSIADFKNCIPELSKKYNLIIPDAPGLGRSEHADTIMSYQLMSKYYSKMIDLLKLDSAYVIGWSDGGIAALLLSKDRPDKIKKVISVGPNYRADGLKIEEVDFIKNKLCDTNWVDKNLSDWVNNYNSLSPQDNWKKYIVEAKRMWFEAEYFPRAVLEIIKVPTLIIYGDNDMYTLEHGLDIYRAINGSQFGVLPNTSHEVFSESPKLFNQIACDFLSNPQKSVTSEITCPKCGHKKVETLPTDVCQLAYTCEKCKNVMHPKEGDCCVFCTYGDHKCPSMQ